MSSGRSERPRLRRTLAAWRATLLLVWVLVPLLQQAAPSPAYSGEARERGRNATITWLDEGGNRRQSDAKGIRYGYFTRTYFDVPKDGGKYRDSEHTDKGLPFAGSFIRFYYIENARFEWTAASDEKGGQLMLILTMSDGHGVRTESAATLAGTIHPRSPYISFSADGVEQRIELLPMSSAAERKGKPQILEMIFTM